MVRRLDIHGLPRISGLRDLADHLNCSTSYLGMLAFNTKDEYQPFRIQKKSGGHRLIHAPSDRLKKIQRQILRTILCRLHNTDNCFGFVPGRNIRDNASSHARAAAVLNLDIENFFGSVEASRVLSVFRQAGYNTRVSWLLCQLCTHRNVLPQGAPTSPQLANFSCYRMDVRLHSYCMRRSLIYTRYADDLSFSGQSRAQLAKVKPFLCHIVSDSGFSINHTKTRLLGTGQRLSVTGLVVGPNKVGIGRQKLRRIRAEIHRAHLSQDSGALPRLQGLLDYVYDVDPARYEILVQYLGKLDSGTLAGLRTRSV